MGISLHVPSFLPHLFRFSSSVPRVNRFPFVCMFIFIDSSQFLFSTEIYPTEYILHQWILLTVADIEILIRSKKQQYATQYMLRVIYLSAGL